ncbi:MAG: hypothetical protein GC136_07670 [Alphaproteobacteria bacterium]|nr:hypothetical protein [Alphaproteobacteria bacterium]
MGEEAGPNEDSATQGYEQMLARYTDPASGLLINKDIEQAIFNSLRGQDHITSHMIVGDFLNLGQANKALGKERADRLMRAIVLILQHYLHTANPALDLDPPSHSLVGFRSNGDELAFFITGVSKEALADALRRTEGHIGEHVKAGRFGTLVHSKGRKRPSGAGLKLSSTEIGAAHTDIESAKTAAFAFIEEWKSTHVEDKDAVVIAAEKFHSLESDERIDSFINSVFKEFGQYTGPVLTDALKTIVENTEVSPITSFALPKEYYYDVCENILPQENSAILRFDVHNLTALNKAFTNEGVDQKIIIPTLKIIEDAIQPYPAAKLVTRGGGLYDLIIPDITHEALAALKDTIYKETTALFNETRIPGQIKASTAFALAAHPDAAIATLENSRDGFYAHGAGVMIVEERPQAGDSVETIDQRMSAAQRLQKIHGILRLDKVTDKNILASYIRNGEIKHFDINDVPLAMQLAANLTDEQTLRILKMPCGQIVENILGISLTPVLEQQARIDALLNTPGQNPAHILAQLEQSSDPADFLALTSDIKLELSPIDPADRPSVLIRDQTPALLTMNLARKWGVFGVTTRDIPDVILSAQIALRALALCDEYATKEPQNASLKNYEAWEKRTKWHTEKNSVLRSGQELEYQIRLISAGRELLDLEPDPAVIDAIKIDAAEILAQAGRQFEKMGIAGLAAALVNKSGFIKNTIKQATTDRKGIVKNALKDIDRQVTAARLEERQSFRYGGVIKPSS